MKNKRKFMNTMYDKELLDLNSRNEKDEGNRPSIY